MGGEELKWHQLVYNQLMSLQGPHFSPHSTAKKPTIKAQISGKLVSSGISDVAFASVYSEITCLKKLIMIIIIMNLSQETTVIGGCEKLTSAMKLRQKNGW